MSPNLKSDQDSVEANILALAQDLLSRDPTRFNSCINHNFESQSTYKGHGVELKGVSNIKHAATLFNTLDGGKAAVVKRENIAWDPESTTATIHSIRFLRPIFSPITFSLPIKTVLRFNSEDVPDVDGSNTKASKIPGESLFVTSFEDEWPIEGLVRKIPVVRSLFKSLYVPIFTFFVLTLANLVFSIQSRFTTQFHSPKAHDLTRKANKLKFQVPAPVAFKEGFEVGKNSTDKLIKGTYSKGSKLIRPPLRFVEFGLQKSTNLVNFLLPTGLIQLPWPSILEENSVDPRVKLGGGQKKEDEKDKEKSKERSGPSAFASALKNAENPTSPTSKKESTPAPSNKEQEEEKNVPPAQDTTEPTTTTTDNTEFNSNEIPSDHATVLVGASEVSPAKELSIPEAQLNEDGAKPHQVKKQDQGQGEKEKDKKDKGTGTGKGSVKGKGGKNKERPKTLFDRIEMPKPSPEASISLVGTQGGDGNGNGNSNVESATSSSSSSKSNSNSNSSETITQSPTSPTTSTSSPILNQGSKTDELEIKEGGEDSTGANANASSNKGSSQKKKKNNKKKSGRGGKAGGGGNGQVQQAQSSGPAA